MAPAMDWRDVYHRVFALAVAVSLTAYAVLCFRMGSFHLPLRHANARIGSVPPWSPDRQWASIGGAGGYVCMLALLATAAGMLVLPAPASTQEQWQKEAKYAAAAKALLLAAGALLGLGIVLAVFAGSGLSPAPSDATVQQIQQWGRQRTATLHQFDSAQFVCGIVFSVLLVGLLVDMYLRYRAGRERLG